MHLEKNKNKILIAIILIAATLRLWNLGGLPPHLRNDEASFGYNAYSILKTGKDEHGEFLPILFKSFGDWKPGLYVYLTIPFVAVLGLNEWAVRLPAAISGIIGVYILYHLTFELLKKQRFALASAFSLSISPWHITFSRGAWEAQVTITLILAGLYFFIKALNKNLYLIPSSIFFGTSLLISHGAKPAMPLVLLSFLMAYRVGIKRITLKILLFSCTLLIILSLPIIFSFFNGKNTRVTSLFFTNKYQSTEFGTETRDLLKNWANHYSLPILFIKGDTNPQHSAPDYGAFISLDIVFLFLGLEIMSKLKDIKRAVKVLIFLLLILAPLSSVLTLSGVNFERYLVFFVVLNIVIGLGIGSCKKNLGWSIFLLFYIFSFLLFLDAYFVHNVSKNGAWQTGYKDIVKFTTPLQKNFQKIYISQGGDQPYIFFLFYQKYSPQKFQSASPSITLPNGSGVGMDYISRLDNIEFIDLNKFHLPKNQSFLVIVPTNNSYEFESSLRIIHEIKDPLGFTIYKIEEYIPKKS